MFSGMHTSTIAFSATSYSEKAYKRGETVIFDTTLVNIGNYYSSQTGTFTCPVDGFYQFTVVIAAAEGHHFR